ncbi:unnamed protein product [Somion occarium]|uniref:Cytochrome c-type biogenesis protein H TPR domain-containing protein n=1 Tax=Somion occarium TaxID=3059160 RepID=A0ABP1CMX5_9APHY
MSVRQTPRQPDRDIRLHEPHTPHGHPHPIPPPHAMGHPPHLNGNGHVTTPLVAPSAPAQVVTPAAAANGVVIPPSIQKLNQANEQTWLLIGRVAEQMGNLEHALSAYENALRHNPESLSGLTQVAGIARIKENYPKAVEYFCRVLKVQQENGEVWSALGHCYLMQDDLQRAYQAYQQALYYLPNPKDDPKLWYGIGILYDRYGSLDHAEEAFSSVLRMDKDFDKANEILFRLGIIYKQQGKYNESLECFDRILKNPPNPLAHADIWFQIGHVYEQMRDLVRARDAYERVVRDNPGHAKVLQQLGWLYHQDGSSFQNQDLAIQYLTKSLEADPSDAQSWYLLGRAYMAGQKYNKAYEAYQQAVYRDGRNPTFWCSIGVLYFQINQYRDALDAYSRAIRINPYISEVWFDLGSLYESCNNQISDAIDAYARAAELDPSNTAIAQRLQLLKTAQATGGALPAAPGPQDVHPTAYANPLIPTPTGLTGPPLLLHSREGPRPIFRTDSRGPGDLPLPAPAAVLNGRSSPGPFRGGPPPPVVLDDNHAPSQHALAPMHLDHPPLHRETGPYRENGRTGPQTVLLHQPTPQPILGDRHPQQEVSYPRPIRMTSPSPSPPPTVRPSHVPYEPRPPMGPGQAGIPRSPPGYPRDVPSDREPAWERRPPIPEHRDWERERPQERRARPPDYPAPHQQQQPYYAPRPHSPPYPQQRPHSPRGRDSSVDRSPRVHPGYGRQYPGPGGPPAMPLRSPPTRRPSVSDVESTGRRYDPRYDAREPAHPREYANDSMVDGRYVSSPEAHRMRAQIPPPQPPMFVGSSRASESPRVPPQPVVQEPPPTRRRRGAAAKDKDADSNSGTEPQKKERKKRAPRRAAAKEGTPMRQQPAYAASAVHLQQAPPFKSSNDSPEPASSQRTGSSTRSTQPSPTNSIHAPPSRELDENYDEGVAETLMHLHSYQPSDPRGYPPPPPGANLNGSVHSPSTNRLPQGSPHIVSRYPAAVVRNSPPINAKRPLSPGPDDHTEMKRAKVGSVNRRNASPPGGRPTPTPSRRPSPIPFRQQPTSHSPESRQVDNSSPAIPTMLPPHPRPIGAGLAGHAPVGPGMPLPPLSTRSPPSMEDDHMGSSRSASPPRGQGKREIVLHPTGSPQGPKGTPSPSSSHHSHVSHSSRGAR